MDNINELKQGGLIMNDNTWSTLGYSRNSPRLKKSEVNKILSVLKESIEKG